MANVYIPHIVRRLDRGSGKLKGAIDLSAAARVGSLKEVIGEFEDLLLADKVAAKAKEVLKEFTDDDFLLAVGDPTVIAICAGVLFQNRSVVKMLKWDRRMSDYIQLEIRV